MSKSEPYHRLKFNGKRRSVHRVIMEQIVGRPLRKDEFVHHKNGDKRDNRPENLEIISPAEHVRLHNAERITSQETRAKMSRAHLGNKYALGFKQSLETIRKKTEARRGVPLNYLSRLSVLRARQRRMKTYVLLSPTGERIEVFGLNKFCQQHGLLLSGIAAVIRGHLKTYKGWRVLEVQKHD